jgi:hypothetical protein
MLPKVLVPHCGSVVQNTLAPDLKTTVFVFESGVNINESDFMYIGMLMSNLQEQNMKPLIILANLREPVKWLS